MNDINKILENLKEQLSDIQDKVKSKLDGIDDTLAIRLKECGEELKNFTVHFKTNDSMGSNKEKNEKPKRDEFADKIEKIAPYLDEDTLHDAVKQFTAGEIDLDIGCILPYLGEDSISLLMRKLIECGGEFNGLEIGEILPYAESDDVNAAFMAKAKNGIIDTDMMPYIDDDCWHELVVEYCENENSKLNIDEAYPYLDDEDVALLFKTYLKRRKKNG